MVGEYDSLWQSLWQSLGSLQEGARKLRHLSQQEPLLQARPDYPRARVGRSHADEVRDVLAGIAATLAETQKLLPQVLRDGRRPEGISVEETPPVLARRIEALVRLTATLQDEAFRSPPPLPQHAPPYLGAAPRHDLVGTNAITLSLGVDELVSALRNLLLAGRNDEGS